MFVLVLFLSSTEGGAHRRLELKIQRSGAELKSRVRLNELSHAGGRFLLPGRRKVFLQKKSIPGVK